MTKFSNKEGSLFRSVLNYHDDGGDLCIQPEKAIILPKNGYGLSFDDISRIQQEKWHVCGLETDACVLACMF